MADPAKSRRCEVAHAQHAQTIQQSNFKQNPPSFIEAQLAKTPKKWLITGVAGFIGSNLLETLLKLDQAVVGLDNFATGYQRNRFTYVASSSTYGFTTIGLRYFNIFGPRQDPNGAYAAVVPKWTADLICSRVKRPTSTAMAKPAATSAPAMCVRHSLADLGKAQRLLGFAPTHRLAEGLAEAMPWYVGLEK